MGFAQPPALSFPSPLLVPCLPDDLIQLTAMCWMREFIQLAGRVMLPYSSGILTAVLPCLSYDDRKKSILVTPSRSHSCYSNPQGTACFLPLGRRRGPGEILPTSPKTRAGALDVRGVAVAGLGHLWWGCGGFSVAGQIWHLGLRVPYTVSTQTSRRWRTCATRA